MRIADKMIKYFGKFQHGYTQICDQVSDCPDMMMDIGIQKMIRGENLDLIDELNECAILLMEGEVIFHWESDGDECEITARRTSIFDENPTVLHLPCGASSKITALSDVELLIQKTENAGDFPARLYAPQDISSEVFGDGVWGNTARRICRTVFDYSNAPWSNMVMGEIINYPGRWSSYIPHGHPQPEVYVYRFDRDEGFGAAFLGDDVFKISQNSAFFIPGGPTHPQVSAPGFAMYYCWMIRHLPGNPWVSRDNDPRYEWLLGEDVKIWGEE
jgi:5-deoxy-glucuronate isomerase